MAALKHKFVLGLVVVSFAQLIAGQIDDFYYGTFPDDFRWGFATAAYQIEGGWDADGKGENIWDNFTHSRRDDGSCYIQNCDTGDVACDSYGKWREDVQLLKALGADYYRFSLSWSRILPTGRIDVINEPGITYYNNLIDNLIANGIEPMITLYHWDLPQPLQDLGGWPNEALVDYFSDFARLAYQRFGDRVKFWITFNEAYVVCQLGYGDAAHAPGIGLPATEPYKCAHTVLMSHANAYRIYESEFKPTQGGVCGITIDTDWFEPFSSSAADRAASERAMQFKHGWYASPIFFGKYPDVMREYIDRKSEEEGLSQSRLPTFTPEWAQKLNGSWDFLGLNHYTTLYTEHRAVPEGPASWGNDQDTNRWQPPTWDESNSSWLKVVPWGFRNLLNWIKRTYGNPLLYVTENGFSDSDAEGVNDLGRVSYYRNYINQMLKAIRLDGCNVKSYTAWSLIDNFEWARGYSERFGAHYVDFTRPDRPRVPKQSAAFLKQVFEDNGFPRP